MHVYHSISLCVEGEILKKREQGGPSGLVPIWYGVDPAAQEEMMISLEAVFVLICFHSDIMVGCS
jgi:hypothetical protein